MHFNIRIGKRAWRPSGPGSSFQMRSLLTHCSSDDKFAFFQLHSSSSSFWNFTTPLPPPYFSQLVYKRTRVAALKSTSCLSYFANSSSQLHDLALAIFLLCYCRDHWIGAKNQQFCLLRFGFFCCCSRNMESGYVPSVGQCTFISLSPYSDSGNDKYYYFYFLALDTEGWIVVSGKAKTSVSLCWV